MKPPIYLDYNATTPVDPRVLEAMLPYLKDKFGNASSASHVYGWQASEATEQARESIAHNIGATDKQSIIFTSGATESNNLALFGIARSSSKPIHLITQKTEHASVLAVCEQLEKAGHQVTYLNVDSHGLVNPDDIKAHFKSNTRLVSIMTANNEIGTIQPIKEIGALCRDNNILFHTDAAQAIGKIPLDVLTDNIDLMSFSAHKIYGPKGSGGLYVKNSSIPLTPLLHGGGHEQGKRSGTLNTPGIIGLAKAIELCVAEQKDESKRLITLRDQLITQIQNQVESCHLNGHPQQRLAGNISLSFDYIKANDLITALPQLAIATGSACSSDTTTPSHVITAIASEQRASSTIRISLGRWTTEEEITQATDLIIQAVKKLRSSSLEFEMAQNN